MTVSFEVPNEIYAKAAAIAQAQSMSFADVSAAACADHIAAWDRLEQRARRADEVKFRQVLSQVPDVEPDERDLF